MKKHAFPTSTKKHAFSHGAPGSDGFHSPRLRPPTRIWSASETACLIRLFLDVDLEGERLQAAMRAEGFERSLGAIDARLWGLNLSRPAKPAPTRRERERLRKHALALAEQALRAEITAAVAERSVVKRLYKWRGTI